jgi:hypothetical protein
VIGPSPCIACGIGIEKESVAELAEGTAVRLNEFNTTLRRDGRYLIYNDKEGVENRCRILMEDEASPSRGRCQVRSELRVARN